MQAIQGDQRRISDTIVKSYASAGSNVILVDQPASQAYRSGVSKISPSYRKCLVGLARSNSFRVTSCAM